MTPELLVLAGGFGTRLRSAVSEVPKPLAPVEGRPFLHYLIEQWIVQGISHFCFLLHHQAEQIEQYLAEEQVTGLLKGCKIDTVIEPEPMGTGGAVAFAVRKLGLAGSFLVVNADTWLGSGIRQISMTQPPALAAVRMNDAGRYGAVHIEQDTVLAFREKHENAGAGLINAGLYHLTADVFLQWDGRPFSLEKDLFVHLAASGRLHAVSLDTPFIDIGIPEDYFRFCHWIRSEKKETL
ncbi:MAG: nucleotidyltransferase family protein [Nitrospirota bacterium]|nr:nucleotidyltransferase family protein [Nitrospirota bacterium]